MERVDRPLSVSDRTGRGRVHPGIAGARVPGASREAHLPAGITDRLILPAGCAFALTVALGTPGALLRDVSHPSSHFGDGDVWLRLSVVPHGRSGSRDLARLPPRNRPFISVQHGLEASHLPGHDPGFLEHRRTRARHRRSRRVADYGHWNPLRLLAAWICWIHFRFGESQSLVVHPAHAGRLSVLR